jgi:hypothetical protein
MNSKITLTRISFLFDKLFENHFLCKRESTVEVFAFSRSEKKKNQKFAYTIS